jgi:hypothetical protein
MSSIEVLGLLFDVCKFIPDVWVVRRKVSKLNEYLLCGLPVVLLGQKARGLRTEHDTD